MAGRSLTRVQGGVTTTLHINTDRLAGVRTMTVTGKPLDDSTTSIQVTVSGHSDISGIYTLNGTGSYPKTWTQQGGNGTIEYNLTGTDAFRWILYDVNDGTPFEIWAGGLRSEPSPKPWNASASLPSSITIEPAPETLKVYNTAPVITSDRKGASRPLLSKLVGGAAAAYSLRDLNDKAGYNKVVRVRKGYAQERDFSAKEVSNGTLEDWVKTFPVNAQNFNTVNVSGIIHAGSTSNSVMNGSYGSSAASNGKKKFIKTHQYGDSEIEWMSGSWHISHLGVTYFTSDEDTTYPWSVTTWTAVGNRTGTPTFSSDGFVSVWYDQSGNSNHAIQPTIWRQPRIFFGGSFVKDSRNNPAIEFSNDSFNLTSDLGTSGAYSCIACHELDFSTMILRANGNSPRVRAASNGYQINFPTFPVASTQGLVSVIKDSSHNARVYSDGTQSSGGQKNVGSTSEPFKYLATNYGFGGGNGKLVELIYYTSDQSANRPAIEANINNQYGIY